MNQLTSKTTLIRLNKHKLATKHQSYFKDTSDFLHLIEKLNFMELHKNTILVTIDVSALYKNIPQDEGLECVREVLDERDVQNIPTGLLTRLLEIILKVQHL